MLALRQHHLPYRPRKRSKLKPTPGHLSQTHPSAETSRCPVWQPLAAWTQEARLHW